MGDKRNPLQYKFPAFRSSKRPTFTAVQLFSTRMKVIPSLLLVAAVSVSLHLPTTVAVASEEDTALQFVGRHETHPFRFPLGPCQGHCRTSKDCHVGLSCLSYNGAEQGVPGCKVVGNNGLGRNFCSYPVRNTSATEKPPPLLKSLKNVKAKPMHPLTVVKSSEARPLGLCQGRCSGHEDCRFGLNCFRRQGGQPVPGCSGNDKTSRSYCFKPLKGVLVRRGVNGVPESAFPLRKCQGHCAGDAFCSLGLICFRRIGNQAVPDCRGNGILGVNYCTVPTVSNTLVRVVEKSQVRRGGQALLAECEGECLLDSHCKKGLRCFKRQSSESVRGCTGQGIFGGSYCIKDKRTGTEKENSSKKPKDEKDNVDSISRLDNTSRCTVAAPCSKCQGDCAGSNDKCKRGLICFSRTTDHRIPGCAAVGVSGIDYCSVPPKDKPVTYVPGKLSHVEEGLLLSTGLTARLIATKHQPVKLEHNGKLSKIRFHPAADGAAVFANKQTGGWKYVSNAESRITGGVGAIEFDARGKVIGYERLLSGSQRNCGGGATFWSTWLSCEEIEGGQIWEVDPFGKHPPRKTIIGVKGGDTYESAAYDNRKPERPIFYVTTDNKRGPVLKFTPDSEVTSKALKSNDFSRLLHSNETGTARTEFLVLRPNKKKASKEGTFLWTEDLKAARKNAFQEYSQCEGIDFRNGIVYFTCKRNAHLFILDTNRGTYIRESTKQGAFNGSPDQVARVLGGNESDAILYFCEETGPNGQDCGVHGRDSNGNYFTILENFGHRPELAGEVTGLAFSPDNMRMYVSYQKPGYIFEVKRLDGYPFGGQRLDIKHGTTMLREIKM